MSAIKKYNDAKVAWRRDGIIIHQGPSRTKEEIALATQRVSQLLSPLNRDLDVSDLLPLGPTRVSNSRLPQQIVSRICEDLDKRITELRKNNISSAPAASFWDKDVGLRYDTLKNEVWQNPVHLRKESRIEIWNPQTQVFETVKGLIDSGAAKTAGSARLHLCGNALGKTPVEFSLQDASGNNVPSVGVSYLKIRLSFPGVKPYILLHDVQTVFVDTPGWTCFLLGCEVLRHLEASPRTILTKRLLHSSSDLHYFLGNKQHTIVDVATTILALADLPKDGSYQARLTQLNTILSDWKAVQSELRVIHLQRSKFRKVVSLFQRRLYLIQRRNMLSKPNYRPSVPEKFELGMEKIGEHDVHCVAEYLGEDRYCFQMQYLEDRIKSIVWQRPAMSFPIQAEITAKNLQHILEGRVFDVVLADPPWSLAPSTPTRGPALAYAQMKDRDLLRLPLGQLINVGFLFLWVINSKIILALDWVRQQGFKVVEWLVWIKRNPKTNCISQTTGNVLRRGKELCLLCRKGIPDSTRYQFSVDVLESPVSLQSGKPRALYQLIERLVPNGRYLELFGRLQNVRTGWTTVGNELRLALSSIYDVDGPFDSGAVVG